MARFATHAAPAFTEYSHRVGVTVTLELRLFPDRKRESVRTRVPNDPPAYMPKVTVEQDGSRRWSLRPSRQEELELAKLEGRSMASDDHVRFYNLLPRSVKWRNNPHRVADELEVDLPLMALPLPPDGSLIRSISIEMRRGLIAPDDWAEAMVRGIGPDGLPLNVPLSDPGIDADFIGFVDKHTVKVTPSGSLVHLKARDFSAVLADEPMRGRTLDPNLPLDESIAKLIAQLPAAGEMELVWMSDVKPPILGEFAASSKKKGGKAGASGKAMAAAKPDHTTVLEAIANACTLGAVTPTFVGYQLLLAPAATLNTQQLAQVRRLILGRNIESLELDHALTQAKSRGIELRSFDPDTGKVIAARYPKDPYRHGPMEPGETYEKPTTGPVDLPVGAKEVDEKHVEVMVVQNCTDPDQLHRMARNVFEELARQELTGKIHTRDIATVEGREAGEADLLRLRAGDPIQVEISSEVETAAKSFVQRLARLPREQAKAEMIAAGYDPRVAERLVAGALAADQPLTYRVREIDFSWSATQGTRMEISIINFVATLDTADEVAKKTEAKVEKKAWKPSKVHNVAPVVIEEVPYGRARRAFVDLMTGETMTYEQKWQEIDGQMRSGEITKEEASRRFAEITETAASWGKNYQMSRP